MAIIRILETIEEMEQVEELQRVVWLGSETDVVPSHLLITLVHNGGLVLGAYDGDKLVGTLFGFVGLYDTPAGSRPKHCSHQMGVLPEARDAGIGFALKRAQWQFVRQQGLDCITWTYDPLLSRNGNLNIAQLGAVCNTYMREVYGEMRDDMNAGLASDRFQVDLWVNTAHVSQRMGDHPGPALKLADFESAHAPIFYPVDSAGVFIRPPGYLTIPGETALLAEIPSDFLKLKAADFGLACDWRQFTREMFETSFADGYLVTDFVYDTSGGNPRSFYVLTRGPAIS